MQTSEPAGGENYSSSRVLRVVGHFPLEHCPTAFAVCFFITTEMTQLHMLKRCTIPGLQEAKGERFSFAASRRPPSLFRRLGRFLGPSTALLDDRCGQRSRLLFAVCLLAMVYETAGRPEGRTHGQYAVCCCLSDRSAPAPDSKPRMTG